MLEKCLITGFADEIDKSCDVQCRVLKELGQNYIELRGVDGIGVNNLTLEQAINYKKRFDESNIKISAIGSPIGKMNITDDFEDHFSNFMHVVELASIMDTKNIRMFSFFMPEGSEPKTYRDEVMKRLDRMVQYAQKKNVVLLHENEKGIYGDSIDRCVDLMQNFHGENFGCTFDFANFVQCAQDTMEAYEALKNYISYIHVKDAKKADGKVVLIGDGDGNVKDILTLLDKSGYEGFLSLEPHLSDFFGFKVLERGETEKKEMDGIIAYRMSFNALKDILLG